MLKMKFIGSMASTLALGVLLPAAAEANTIYLYYGQPLPAGYSYGAGAEFTAVTDPNAFNKYYAPSTLVNVSPPNPTGNSVGFQTFCVQTEVEYTPFNWNTSIAYSWTTSLSSVGALDNFALSEGTAYLYSQFATGKLNGYHYNDQPTRQLDAGQLQAAIWELQGHQSYGGVSGLGNGTTGNIFYNDALNALKGHLYDPATLNDNFGVEILNLTALNNPNAAAQNQLVYVGVPDSGTTLSLLTLSLAGLVFFTRSRRTSAPPQMP